MDGEEERNGNSVEVFEGIDFNLVYWFLDLFLNDVYVLNNLFDLLKIIRINLVGNYIFVFFDFIGMFFNFRVMDILVNGLVYIIFWIGELWYLKIFIVKNNNLVDLLKEFVWLVVLENFNLSGNGFELFML